MAYIVDAVQEALGLLMQVAQAPGLGVTELARRSGNTKARAFRLLSTLEHHGFVQRSADGTSYMLGRTALVLGMAAQEQVDLVRVARPHLDGLGARFNENCSIRVRDGLQSVTVAKWDSTRGVRVVSKVGTRRPLHAGATGKVLLAFAPDEVLAQTLAQPLQRFTPATSVNRSKLPRELARIRADGHAMSHGEVVPDAVGFAVPVRDPSGAVVAALGLSLPSSRVPDDGAPYLQALKAVAGLISAELGGGAA